MRTKRRRSSNDYKTVSAQLNHIVSSQRKKGNRTPTPNVNDLMELTSANAYELDPVREATRKRTEMVTRELRAMDREVARARKKQKT
jgi:hypothetical protein